MKSSWEPRETSRLACRVYVQEQTRALDVCSVALWGGKVFGSDLMIFRENQKAMKLKKEPEWQNTTDIWSKTLMCWSVYKGRAKWL